MMRLREHDRGAALIAVVVLGFVMMVLVATGLTVATSGLRQAVGVQRSTSALDAAFAGVQDYLARLNHDSTYTRYGNPDSTFSSASRPIRPDPWNPAFGVGVPNGNAAHDKYTTWATIPGSNAATGDNVAQFRYEADSTQYTTTGIVRLRVTGLAAGRTRTILTSIRVKGFVDYAYFTDYEIQDPASYYNDDPRFDPTACVKYAWAGRSSTCTSRMGVKFVKADIVYGDVHTNDTPILTCGATFSGVVETSTPTSNTSFYTNARNCNPTINAQYSNTLPMPATNTAMKQDAACVYTGPTKITYHSDGTMVVVSPWTRYTHITGTPSNPAACGSISALHSAGGARVPQLAQDLLYVQNVQGGVTDPNYWAPTSKPSWVTCVGPDGLDTSAATGTGWSIGSGSSQIRYPLVGESPATSWAAATDPTLWDTSDPAYGCRNGDLYVSGAVTTLTTAASENYVYIVNDITYADRTNDVLGLVGQQAVIVWNPMDQVNDQPMLSQFNLQVSAAIVSLLHTFQVQNYDRGATRGSLEVFGSIAQRFRGPVVTYDTQTGQPLTGYTKAYQYDTLLKTVSPPKFLAPSAVNYSVLRYAGVPTAFTPTGAIAN